MAKVTLNDGDLGSVFRTGLNSNFTELYNFVTGVAAMTAVDINGGAIDGTPVGAATPSTGAFTTLQATSLNSTPIGATTASTGAFTSLTATSLSVSADSITVTTAKTPASATDTGTQGQIAWDASYIYVCTATNVWVRAALATW